MKNLKKGFTSLALACSMLLGIAAPMTSVLAVDPPEDAPQNAVLVEMESAEGLLLENGARTAEDNNPSNGQHVVIDDGNADSSISFNLTVPAAGNYSFDFCYIAGDNGQEGKNDPRQIKFTVNEADQGVQGFDSTQVWTMWMHKTVTLPLNEGQNTIKIASNGTTGNGICIDNFTYGLFSGKGTLKEIRFQNLENGSLKNLAVDEVADVSIEEVYDSGFIKTVTSSVTYTSADESIVKVRSDGKLMGMKAGSTTITASYSGSTVSAQITVYAPEVPLNATIYEAEKAKMSNGLSIKNHHPGYTGNGFVDGYTNNDNGKLTFTVNTQTEGAFKIALRYASGKVAGWPDDRTMVLQVNDGAVRNVVFPTTNDWGSWLYCVVEVTLQKGENTITIANYAGDGTQDGINIDHLALWKDIENPELSSVYFEKESYTVGAEGESILPQVMGLYTDEISRNVTEQATFTSSDEAVFTVEDKRIVGKKAGQAELTATIDGYTASVNVNVGMIATIDFAQEIKAYDPSMFGYILTPNYDIADSRVTLLGPVMNRDTFPAQNFQAISDLDATYYAYEDSVLQRAYEGYIRATEDLGTEFYLLAGHLPSWTTGGAPHHGAPTNLAWFKQYIKDAL